MNEIPTDPDILRLLLKGEFETVKNQLHLTHFSNWCQEIQQMYPFIREYEVYSAWLKIFSVFKTLFLTGVLKLIDASIIGKKDSLPVHLHNMVKQDFGGGGQFKKVSRESEDYRVIYAIQEGSDKHMKAVYHHFRSYFSGYASKHYPRCTTETVEDIFQDTLIVLIEYVKQEKIRIQESANEIFIIGLNARATIKTMIIAIGRRMLARNCSNSKETSFDPAHFFGPDYDTVIEELESDREEMIQAILKVIRKLRHDEKQLLFYRYWLEFSSDQIREILKADTAGAIRTRLTRLRDKIKRLLN